MIDDCVVSAWVEFVDGEVGMGIESQHYVECADGSVEIYESSKKKNKQALMFVAASVLAVGTVVCMRSSSNLVMSHMTMMFGIPLAVTVLLLTVVLVLPHRKSSPKAVVKFTRDGFTAFASAAKWADISKAYATEHECVLLSRKAGEIIIPVLYLDLTAMEVLEIAHRFAPHLNVE